MHAIVTDAYGKVRVINVWENKVICTIGGSDDEISDKNWRIGGLYMINPDEAAVIHDSGKASFFEFQNNTRKSILDIGEQAKSFSLHGYQDKLVGCFNGYVAVFNEEKVITKFDTIKASCANSFENLAAYGRINDRCVVYDVEQQKDIWTSAPPPNDELGIPLKDDDSSIEFYNDKMFLVGQAQGGVLVYDLRAGSEPIVRAKVFEEFPAIVMRNFGDNIFAFGDTSGQFRYGHVEYDEEKDKITNVKVDRSFYGMTGGIVDLAKHPSAPIVASLCCSRTIHLFDTSKTLKEAAKVAYTKVMPTCFVLRNDELPNEDSSEADWDALPENGEGIWDNYTPCPQSKKNKE
ncbi:hypothetical protein TVAG_394400 [Trichomonas vaginalis G3]|uniref:Uncharacterized protein n=1 Tax=Trichomonas vaginalis (strain ATCC PRA-98 / G3) TaxID=412133 RepID=A2DWF6_TRIV3|nr:Nop seven associated protein 1 family [Trichomonas vaginalis G3]EAY15296.1 hypothetical protein TVAG_394400 [Trichomonas vaginalis G3]KAI5536594.1 Nop seven associated protein 1 family [Trichomonas vaginalis G3]|eukprot:XP_001327519.1 hypothetical protein [Trichomonas vaginalis G3]